uniref:DDE Tnp4 domain-containing protein n=1 Tax=Mycena chlorophos TaxID=658473 RepID=A0ABQ0LVL3_MYCCL|nr:predicted protein [Mycena chlorophos]
MARTDSRRGLAAGLIKAAKAHVTRQMRLRIRQMHHLRSLGLPPAALQRLQRIASGIPRRRRTWLFDDTSSWSSSSSSSSDSSDSLMSLDYPKRLSHQQVGSSSLRVLHWVQHQIDMMYSRRYTVPRLPLIRPEEAQLNTCLKKWKHHDKAAFRGDLRIWPTTFDRLLEKIEGHPVFTNNSNNGQTPVEIQLAVALYQFGHDGNGVSLQAVAWWSGLGKGTIPRCTRRVITAILGSGMLAKYVRMPTANEKESAKAWVEKTFGGCREGREGWCMVDGTLIPLAFRPSWYGPSYFDRKKNYSMNLQARVKISGFPQADFII